jgi:excisionase family DNA binding protein
VAKLTGYSRRTVSKWARRSKLTIIRPNPGPKGHVRIPKVALIDYLALMAG